MAVVTGYLVRPKDRTIQEVTLVDEVKDPAGHLHNIYDMLECRLITVVWLENQINVIVDDEGLLHNPQHWIRIQGYHEVLAGNALFLGEPDKDGYSTSCPLSLDEIGSMVHCYTNGDDNWYAVQRLENSH
ncbi:hypothetical protein HYP99_gp101 [Sinorhizobium phage ort11]|uniref:DUF3846 domain-containing protein n=1 Tax=Sinorhizobium phage ort11 TaxID=2599764 RepID=A0A5C2H5N9_9CAUD|nr:hypothetical protein HYP99_gp101 [Sinorhizobium phage ort11]QEP29892.1 hypothetical protein Smphiort11_094 [Sinorhizobium phage ort11]